MSKLTEALEVMRGQVEATAQANRDHAIVGELYFFIDNWPGQRVSKLINQVWDLAGNMYVDEIPNDALQLITKSVEALHRADTEIKAAWNMLNSALTKLKNVKR